MLMRKAMTAVLMMLIATCSVFAKERVFIFEAHPDGIISSLGTCLLMRDSYAEAFAPYGGRQQGPSDFAELTMGRK